LVGVAIQEGVHGIAVSSYQGATWSCCCRPTDPETRLSTVSMTLNGPAPTILAMFRTTAIDQRLATFAAGPAHEPLRLSTGSALHCMADIQRRFMTISQLAFALANGFATLKYQRVGLGPVATRPEDGLQRHPDHSAGLVRPLPINT
jgi:hypothetical protein